MADTIAAKKLWANQVRCTINGKTPVNARLFEDITTHSQITCASTQNLQDGVCPQVRGVSKPGWRISFMPPAADEPADPALDDLLAASKDPTKRVKLVITSPAVLAQTLEFCYVQRSGSNAANYENPLEIAFDIVLSSSTDTAT